MYTQPMYVCTARDLRDTVAPDAETVPSVIWGNLRSEVQHSLRSADYAIYVGKGFYTVLKSRFGPVEDK